MMVGLIRPIFQFVDQGFKVLSAGRPADKAKGAYIVNSIMCRRTDLLSVYIEFEVIVLGKNTNAGAFCRLIKRIRACVINQVYCAV